MSYQESSPCYSGVAGVAYNFVRDSDAAGGTGLCEAEALHHGAAEAHFEELLHMVGQGGPARHDQAHMTPQPSLDLGKHQFVKEWRSLQVQATVRLVCKGVHTVNTQGLSQNRGIQK